MRQAKWTITNHIEAWSSSKESDVVYMVELEGSTLLWAPSGKPTNQFQQVLLQVRPTESRLNEKCTQLVNRKYIIFHQDNSRPHVSLMTRQKNCYSLAGKFGFIHCILQTLYLWISIYFDLHKILLMEKKNVFPGRL